MRSVCLLVATLAPAAAGDTHSRRCEEVASHTGGCAVPPTFGACWTRRPGAPWVCHADGRARTDGDCSSVRLPGGDGHYDGFCTFAGKIPRAEPQRLLSSWPRGKRGVARYRPSPSELRGYRGMVSWGYDWSFSVKGLGHAWSAAHVGFVPMIHDVGALWRAQRGLSPGSHEALLGFNEPDIPSQAAMSPQHAASLWPRVQHLAGRHRIRHLVSPAMAGDKHLGPWWMKTFLNSCRGCRVDAIAIHSYWCTLSDIQDLVSKYDQFGKPIWLTEFCCADPRKMDRVSMEGQIRFMQEVVPWLERDPRIAKYAWFSYFRHEWSYPITSPNPDAGLVRPNGRISRLGFAYRSLPR